jgi:hypothetical protein
MIVYYLSDPILMNNRDGIYLGISFSTFALPSILMHILMIYFRQKKVVTENLKMITIIIVLLYIFSIGFNLGCFLIVEFILINKKYTNVFLYCNLIPSIILFSLDGLL